MRKLFFILPMLLLLLFFMPKPAAAFGPDTHVALMQELCSESYSWPNKDLCCNQYKDQCMLGLLETDATVFYYGTSFHKYQVMHSWDTVDKCFEYAKDQGEKAVCVGMSIHNSEDAVSHNFFVPDVTKQWLAFPEELVHPFAESSIDSRYRAEYPMLEADITGYLSDANVKRYCSDKGSIINRATGLDLSWECGALAGAVSKGGFYQSVFLVGPLMNYAYKGFIAISGLLPINNWDTYSSQAKVFAREAFQGQYERTYDPSGYTSLQLANFGWQIARMVLVGVMIFFILKYLGIFNIFGRRKR